MVKPLRRENQLATVRFSSRAGEGKFAGGHSLCSCWGDTLRVRVAASFCVDFIRRGAQKNHEQIGRDGGRFGAFLWRF